MEDEKLREMLQKERQQLEFTSDDRRQVWEKIRRFEQQPEKKVHATVKKYVPAIVSFAIVGICLLLFLPQLLLKPTNEQIASDVMDNVQKTASVVLTENVPPKTMLLSVKSKEMEDRIYLNLLLNYDKQQKSVNIMALPMDTYAPVSTNADGSIMYDKLLFAYQFGGADNVKRTVSQLIDTPIDEYTMIELEQLAQLIDEVGGIPYTLQQSVTLRAITEQKMDLQAGPQMLTGEQLVALLIALVEPNQLDEAQFVALVDATLTQLQQQLPSQTFTNWLANVESDAHIVDFKLQEALQYEKRYISIQDSIQTAMLDGSYYLQLQQQQLKEAYETFKTTTNSETESLPKEQTVTFTLSSVELAPFEIRKPYFIVTDITWNGDEAVIVQEINFVDANGTPLNYQDDHLAFFIMDATADIVPGVYEQLDTVMEFTPSVLQPNTTISLVLKVIANGAFKPLDHLHVQFRVEQAGQQKTYTSSWETLQSMSVQPYLFDEAKKDLPITEQEWLVYESFKQSKDEAVLQALSPLSIAKLYWLAEIEGDRALQYAFYTTRADAVLWSYEEYLTFSPFDTLSLKEAEELLRAINNGQFIQTAEQQGYISFMYEDNERGFSLLKNEAGIWQVAFMPMQ